MAWRITYTHRGWHGLSHCRNRDDAIAKAHQLASEGKTDIAVYGPDGKIRGDILADKTQSKRGSEECPAVDP
jgi:hypothetical protein